MGISNNIVDYQQIIEFVHMDSSLLLSRNFRWRILHICEEFTDGGGIRR